MISIWAMIFSLCIDLSCLRGGGVICNLVSYSYEKHSFFCKAIRLNVLLWCISCVALMLSSCHTTLYNAAKAGDVEIVRQELATGVPMDKSASRHNLWWQIPTTMITVPLDAVQAGLTIGTLGILNLLMEFEPDFLTKSVFAFGDKTPLEVAYEKGHTAVVDEFVKAGAGVASDRVTHNKMIFQFDEYSKRREDLGFAQNAFIADENEQAALRKFESCWAKYKRYSWFRCDRRRNFTKRSAFEKK